MHNKIIKQINKLTNNFRPEIGIILGSGWSDAINNLSDKITIKYSDLSHMPQATVKGHSGNIILGTMQGKKVAFIQGRFHIYEGYEMNQVVLPITILNGLGVNKLIVTNSAGGVNENYNIGNLVIISGQINLTGKNPLIGLKATDDKPIFVDMTYAYDIELMNVAKDVFKQNNLKLNLGTYLQLTGPTYETPAEVNMAKIIGADLVGMSTAVEVIMANYLKMKVLGISCVTNMAAGMLSDKLSHEDVLNTINNNKHLLSKVLTEIIENI